MNDEATRVRATDDVGPPEGVHYPKHHSDKFLWVVRVAWVAALAGTVGALVVLGVSDMGTPLAFAVQLPGIVALGLVGEIALRRGARRAPQERQLSLSRPPGLEEIATRDDLTQLQKRP